MAQSISQEAIGATGLPGATAASRHAGATTSGAPTTGTFAVGDYVVDQTGAMYVCTVAGTPGAWQLSGVSINENIAGKNFIINGGMDIWQRGTSFAGTGASIYMADRWQLNTASTTTTSQITSGISNIQYAMRNQRTSASTTVATNYIATSLETKNSIPMAGQTVALSFWARAGANFSSTSNQLNAAVVYGTGTDQNVFNVLTGSTSVIAQTATLTTSWQRFTYTGTVGSTATQVAMYFYWATTGTAGANDYFDITGVQLEIAPQATPFSRAGGSIGGELALCQRYYWQVGYGVIANGFATSSTTAQFVISLPVSMRVSPPTINPNGVYLFSASGSPYYAPSSWTLPAITPTGQNLVPVVFNYSSGGLTVGASYYLANSSAATYLGFSAEL